MVKIDERYPLCRAAPAHTDIESHRSAGKLLLKSGINPIAPAATCDPCNAGGLWYKPSGNKLICSELVTDLCKTQ